MYFDKNNNILTLCNNAIYRIDGNMYTKLFELSEKGTISLSFLAVDNDNNIWTGGYQTGLYKIDNQLNITHYHANNSELTTNNMREIYIDKNNVIWIVTGGIGEIKEILKISNGQWVVYDVDTLNPHITSLITDKNGYLWMGAGWENEYQTLFRFDGTQWETVHPQNDKNEVVHGTVRCLRSDNHKIYVVSSRFKDTYNYTHELLTFDGVNWGKIYDIPADEWFNMIVDIYRQVVWIWTDKGVFKIPIQDD
jgi:streptogramin lyase